MRRRTEKGEGRATRAVTSSMGTSMETKGRRLGDTKDGRATTRRTVDGNTMTTTRYNGWSTRQPAGRMGGPWDDQGGRSTLTNGGWQLASRGKVIGERGTETCSFPLALVSLPFRRCGTVARHSSQIILSIFVACLRYAQICLNDIQCSLRITKSEFAVPNE